MRRQDHRAIAAVQIRCDVRVVPWRIATVPNVGKAAFLKNINSVALVAPDPVIPLDPCLDHQIIACFGDNRSVGTFPPVE